MNKSLVSVVVPIYNIEQYLSQAIDSVIKQSIGFTNNIELVLVDDGSSDSSLEIAQDYAINYPQNIIVLSQKNFGVSSARNVGAAKARGEFIHFFDGDDILSKNFYSQMTKFLQANRGVDFVAAKLKFFDEIIDPHPLNYKFTSSRVIDLEDEPDSPLLHVVSCVFRAASIKNKQFDTKVSIAEDVKFLSDMLVDRRRYGVIKKPTYYYRKRTNNGSAIGSKERNHSYYTSIPKRVYQYMLDTWKESRSDSLPIEQTILYDISYRLEQNTQSILTDKEQSQYVLDIKSLLARCSEEAILSSRHLSLSQKLYALNIKHNITSAKTQNRPLSNNAAASLYSQMNPSVFLDFVTRLSGDTYRVEGYIDDAINMPGLNWLVGVDEEKSELEFIERAQRQKSFLGEVYYSGCAIDVEVKWPVGTQLAFYLQTPNGYVKLPLQTGPFTRLGGLPTTYRSDDSRLIRKTPAALHSYTYSHSRHLSLELRILFQICLSWRLDVVHQRLKRLFTYNLSQLSPKAKLVEVAKPWFFMAEAVYYIPRGLLLRTLYYMAKSRKKRPIWLVSDRGMAAGDNGEALFRYIMLQDDCPADAYFVISKKSKDLNRVKQIGPVLDHGGLKYKLKFLLADKIISSHADIEVTNPFLRQIDHFVDLYDFKFVFLQHGIILNDLSSWLNRFDKNIALLITSAHKEYHSIFEYPYYYPEDKVLLSGMPRYDNLENKPANKIIITPTYRNSLLRLKTDKYGARQYDGKFKESEYYRFYSQLIDNPKLQQAMKENGATGEFYIHPNFAAQSRDFKSNDVFFVKEFPYDYREAISTGSLLVSDYSSIVSDFAYLRKPVVYAHFDADTFFEGQPYDRGSFFSESSDGFGPVELNLKDLVETIVGYIDQGYRVDNMYAERMNSFYAYNDRNNSKRVYDKLVSLTKDDKNKKI